MIAAILVIFCGASVVAFHYCHNVNAIATGLYIPQAPDFADTTMWLYSECLQKNIGVRTRAWKESHTK